MISRRVGWTIAGGMLVALASGLFASPASGQVVVQLPTRTQFSVSTTVMVPDGGTMRLGGVGRSAHGSIQRGVPLWGNVPGAGRLARNRATGYTIGGTYADITAQVLVASEREREVLAEAQRRQQQAIQSQLRPDPAVQQRAEFLSRHIGRSNPQR